MDNGEKKLCDNLESFFKLSKVESLQHIINLDLNNCIECNDYVEFFPKLINLKCLIISGCKFNKVPPFEVLQSLEELYMRNVIIIPSTTTTSTPTKSTTTSSYAPVKTAEDSQNTKTFITKIKGLTKLKHIVITGTVFDTSSANDYLIHYLNNSIETLNFKSKYNSFQQLQQQLYESLLMITPTFKEITPEKRDESNKKVLTIKEKQQQQQQQQILSQSNKPQPRSPSSPLLSPLNNRVAVVKTPIKPVISSKRLENTNSSIISDKLNIKQTITSSPISSPISTRIAKVQQQQQQQSVTPQTSPKNRVNFRLPPVLVESSPQSSIGSSFGEKSNIVQAIALLMTSITTLDDIDYIEELLHNRKKVIKNK